MYFALKVNLRYHCNAPPMLTICRHVQLGESRGVEGPVMAFGIISAVLLAAALLPQYYEIWKYKEVKGA